MKEEIIYEKEAVVNAGTVRIAYDSFGDPTAPPLLLIMGLGGQLVLWPEEFCRQLAGRGFRVIRYDHRDVGHSTFFDSAGVPDAEVLEEALMRGAQVEIPYTLYDMADDAVGLLAALGIDSAHVAGTSMGGRIAQILAIRYPERIRTATSIVSHTGAPGFPAPNPATLAALTEPAPTDREEYVEYSIRMARLMVGPVYPVDEEAARKRAARVFDRAFNPDGVMRHYAAYIATGSVRDAIRGLMVPLLIIHGSEDPLVSPDCARDMADITPGAKLMIIDGMGHALADVSAVWPPIIEAVAEFCKGQGR